MKEMNVDRIPTRRTGHVYTLGDGERVNWVVLHGYAQAPEELLDRFPDQAGHRFVAPEGLSKFYRRGFYGEVVTSWMTSKHRLDEIEDQKYWLDTIYESYCSDAFRQNIAFAFSQGSATLLRWLAVREHHFDQVWIWAGSIPEDVDYDRLKKNDWHTSFHFFKGDEDPFLAVNYLDQSTAWAEGLGFEADSHKFEGGHEVPRAILEHYIDLLTPDFRESSES